jgi:DNA-directed RNA polymerase beta' subunit
MVHPLLAALHCLLPARIITPPPTHAHTGRPEDLLLGVIPVPPVAIRPSVEMDGASNEDDITMKLMVR